MLSFVFSGVILQGDIRAQLPRNDPAASCGSKGTIEFSRKMSLTRFHVQNNALSPPPADARTAGICKPEPALLLRRFFFPEILSTGGLTLNSGENVFQQLYRSRPRGAEKDLRFALECMRMPSHLPHTTVNRAKRGLLSSRIPSAHRLLQSGAVALTQSCCRHTAGCQ